LTIVENRTFSNIQVRRGLGVDWTSKNPILLAGEFGLDESTSGIKIGNGVQSWNSLPYFAGTASITAPGTVELATSAETLAVTDGTRAVTPLSLAGFLPAGMVSPFAGSTAPSGWLLADGAAVSRSTFSSLFLTIGTQYGIGNGSTTFNIPDMRGRSPVGRDANQAEFDTLGEAGGAKTHTHTGPSHSHSGPSHTHSGPNHSHTHTSSVGLTSGVIRAIAPGFLSGYSLQGISSVGQQTSITSGGTENLEIYTVTSSNAGTGQTGSAGTGQTGSAGTGETSTTSSLQPYRTLNYIIKA
jgi:microcystin-dependent protein